ncbi:aminoglycoside phosphotransferase family protein [uncultured Tateyamaria sp.]|uniref:aminoglycoside phosphotransferase family protein n=1 Tax=uncultured Tateyamaria sp. TaxID=455651 RepID=UPI0026337018|nr:aminoglycoside phosphotransferase family protein [uncultured Tateyamaria sp.]
MPQALEEWDRIAPDLGMDPQAYRSKLIWQKDDKGRSHVVIRLNGPHRLILKRFFKVPEDAALMETVAAQRSAFERLRRNDQAHAPEVIYASPDAGFVLMAEATGKTLNDHLVAGRAHAPLLRRAGAWLAAFHKSGDVERRTYQPRFMLNHMARLAASVATGDVRVSEPDAFIRCCTVLPEMAVQSQETVSAIKHGDFNLRNILLGPDGATGLDFKPMTNAPIGFDIARLLMDYAELFQPEGQLLNDETLDAFFDGYDLVSRDDPGVRFLPYVQLLTDWRTVPADVDKRSWRQDRRMAAIARLADVAFGTTKSGP